MYLLTYIHRCVYNKTEVYILLQGNYVQALQDLSAAIHLDPNNAAAYYHRACLLRVYVTACVCGLCMYVHACISVCPYVCVCVDMVIMSAYNCYKSL